ncbi:DUF6257 family protein [Streptomyces benahoarensis]|uniref:DUF6257 family protein n=1 Tax=Streptomyces benahoarensis TaxID=2595054 RepID=UPI001C8F6A2A|nr:DUF6257 family protein [Streptomyces benahoarensis]
MAKYDDPKLTAGEKAKVGWYIGRMAKRALAGDEVYQGDLERKLDRVLDGAREREERTQK